MEATLSTIGVQQLLSTAYHPQTERVNQCLEHYLSSMCGQDPKGWVLWLSSAKFWYNNNFHTTIHMTPFEALYGYKPHLLNLGPYLQGVDDLIKDKQHTIHKIRQSLYQAREIMITNASKNCIESLIVVIGYNIARV